ncbi:MAG TPA: hypothetical protein DIC52_16085 [Candidatus Latescibacteria bacterium]|nr:hypothetical protein [Candidatus Latescibacterota bacterium]
MQLIFAGKVLGVLLRVALALVPAAVLRVWGLYLTLAHGLDTQSGYRVLLMLLTTAAYLMLFANLGIWASALARRPSAALMLALRRHIPGNRAVLPFADGPVHLPADRYRPYRRTGPATFPRRRLGVSLATAGPRVQPGSLYIVLFLMGAYRALVRLEP